MAQPLSVPSEFDPLVEFYGMWNTELAENYLPIPRVHAHKYECLGGYLIMSPHEGAANARGEGELYALMRAGTRAAGFVSYTIINLRFNPQTWIEPDLTVLKESAEGATWVPASKALMPIEFVSKSSPRRDRIDKPRLCAEAGIPWYMRVEVDYPTKSVFLRLDRLVGGRYVEHKVACEGQRFRITEPFELDLDPAELLEP